MASVEIYHKGVRVSSEFFWREFYIIKNDASGEVVWRADSERDAKPRNTRPAALAIWVQTADTHPRIPYVLPEWQLAIDDLQLAPKFYEYHQDEALNHLAGKTIELQHADYRFVFHFEPLL